MFEKRLILSMSNLFLKVKELQVQGCYIHTCEARAEASEVGMRRRSFIVKKYRQINCIIQWAFQVLVAVIIAKQAAVLAFGVLLQSVYNS